MEQRDALDAVSTTLGFDRHVVRRTFCKQQWRSTEPLSRTPTALGALSENKGSLEGLGVAATAP